jgi:hypothetical protein
MNDESLTSGTVRALFTKACECAAPQMTNRFVTSNDFDPKALSYRVTVTHFPMPSCSKCNTPWVQQAREK